MNVYCSDQIKIRQKGVMVTTYHQILGPSIPVLAPTVLSVRYSMTFRKQSDCVPPSPIDFATERGQFRQLVMMIDAGHQEIFLVAIDARRMRQVSG